MPIKTAPLCHYPSTMAQPQSCHTSQLIVLDAAAQSDVILVQFPKRGWFAFAPVDLATSSTDHRLPLPCFQLVVNAVNRVHAVEIF